MDLLKFIDLPTPDAIAQKEAQITSVQDDWLISAESIANYRSVAQKLVIPYGGPFFGGNAGLEAPETVIDAVCGQELSEVSLDSLLEKYEPCGAEGHAGESMNCL